MDDLTELVAHHRGVRIVAAERQEGWQARAVGIGALSGVRSTANDAIEEIKRYLDEATPRD